MFYHELHWGQMGVRIHTEAVATPALPLETSPAY